MNVELATVRHSIPRIQALCSALSWRSITPRAIFPGNNFFTSLIDSIASIVSIMHDCLFLAYLSSVSWMGSGFGSVDVLSVVSPHTIRNMNAPWICSARRVFRSTLMSEMIPVPVIDPRPPNTALGAVTLALSRF